MPRFHPHRAWAFCYLIDFLTFLIDALAENFLLYGKYFALTLRANARAFVIRLDLFFQNKGILMSHN